MIKEQLEKYRKEKECKHDWNFIKITYNRTYSNNPFGIFPLPDGRPFAELICIKCGMIKYIPVKYGKYGERE